ncbi:MAG: 5-(carboxyamino)imidazole ribonucleotide mutase [Deltaproteobacteria bacterium]|jgi:5-(carboxyamino)imidazole ribonucleotide mutase|nr:5-(carboxyamino)imidazole ribonucleotide mutase [Deltaproteobacteria bacterium]
MAKVAVFMGSKSDESLVRPCVDLLESWGLSCFFTISSAHRTPERTEELIRALEAEGCRVYICAAGMAAHLAGAVAARTIRPVIGIPLASGGLGGLDALLSTVMMPAGFPVATVALDKTGARNAAWLAAQILALEDESLAARLRRAREELRAEVEKNASLLQGNAD